MSKNKASKKFKSDSKLGKKQKVETGAKRNKKSKQYVDSV